MSSLNGTSSSIVAITETWFLSQHGSASFILDNFTVYGTDRKYYINFTKEGGVLLAVSKALISFGELHLEIFFENLF